jgi:ribose 5-phosphate isomerase RpiB
MKIAILNEISAASRNTDILKALEGRGFELLNLGNTGAAGEDELLYIHTGLMSALLLNLKVVDFVVAGCGTGQGYLNSVMQYPGVFCGHLLTPMDAWLFARINAGNCISLALNQGYGWAGEVNLRLIFDQLFTNDTGKGYPLQRAEPQKAGRERLVEVSTLTHRTMAEILATLPPDLTHKALQYPAFRPVLVSSMDSNPQLRAAALKIIT